MRELRLLIVVVFVAAAVTAVAAAGPWRSVEDPTLGPGFGPGPVAAATPQTAAWRKASEGLDSGLDVGSSNPCHNGQVDVCFDAVVAEMETRFERLGCAHTAPFAFTYLEMTRGVARHAEEHGFFASPAGIANIDALFAQLYFEAFDNWSAGRHEHVPGAWQMAFESAERRASSAAADLLLGMNAHISRDLAYTVALALSAEGPGGANPTDFDLVNEVIDEVRGPMLRESAQRFDPTLAELDIEFDPDLGIDAVDLISRWRTEAFSMGERLAAATGPEEQLAVVAEIERNAVAVATLILNADAIAGTGLSPDDRQAHCERS